MTNFNGSANDGGELTHHAGSDDVVIKIRGRTAAQFLGRGEVEKRILTELLSLRERLQSMEAAAAQRADQHGALSQAVVNLEEKVGQLSGRVADQVAEVRADLARLRNDFDMHVSRVGQIPGQVERVQMQVDTLQRQVTPMGPQLEAVLQARIGALQAQFGSEIANLGAEAAGLHAQLAGLDDKLDKNTGDLEKKIETVGEWWWEKLRKRLQAEKLNATWGHPEKPAADGETPANTSWLRQRLNSFWCW